METIHENYTMHSNQHLLLLHLSDCKVLTCIFYFLFSIPLVVT